MDVRDLRWTLEPLPRLEHVDLLTLTESELLAYTRGLQEECERLREMMHASLDVLARITLTLDRSRRTIANLQEQAHARTDRES